MNHEPTSSLKLLEARFPTALLIKPAAAGLVLNQSQQTSYNQVSRGVFPIDLVEDHLHRKMVRLVDLASYLDGLTATKPALSLPEFHKKRGRPTRREALLRAALKKGGAA